MIALKNESNPTANMSNILENQAERASIVQGLRSCLDQKAVDESPDTVYTDDASNNLSMTLAWIRLSTHPTAEQHSSCAMGSDGPSEKLRITVIIHESDLLQWLIQPSTCSRRTLR